MIDEAAAEDRVGEVVDGRYKILEVMASGSMGAVYRAERVPVGKVVAVKFLHASFANDAEFQARFERETRVMSKLAHPNCVSVLDFGVWQGAPYLVMDFVAGTTLRARMDRGPMPPAQALAIARQLAAGLAHAHQQGVFHRDIKPANIMVTDEIGHGERVRILDFGLARLRGSGSGGRDATQLNMVVGTPNYMAPEQTVPGAQIDARTDIYAVGVVLFEMVVGDRPFHAEETMQLLGMHRAAPIPRLADRAPEDVELPVGLQELIDKAMAKSPADRFQSAIELASAIDDVAGGKPEPLIVKESKPLTGPALAPTMLDVATEADGAPMARRSRVWPGVFGAFILVGGVSAMAGYLIWRHGQASRPGGQGVVARANVADAGAGMGSAEVAPTAVVVGSGGVVGSGDVGAEGSGAEGSGSGGSGAEGSGSGGSGMVAEGSGSGAAGSGSAAAGSGAAMEGSAMGSGGGSAVVDAGVVAVDAEVDGAAAGADDPDPTKAQDVAPSKPDDSDDDEAPDAPQTSAEVAKRTPHPAPHAHIASNLHDAVLLIKAGKNDLALESLQRLAKKSPKSAYIPFLIGNIYFDRKWWSVALEHYQTAIEKNREYRNNPTLNRNVVRMLGNSRTRNKAVNFLRGVVGHPSLPYLKNAAANDKNAAVRTEAKRLYPYIH